ncbi:quinolinate synthetase [Heyndrickxia shackletonii]|uniref:Quinolinate synthase n=1 Tax=Heyndrickxia shackletonii TaxID=157838 RepID=A0A0Q3WXA9_9BACI|nr:quinolinate synthase NadA [Heyndrickxia shackletonii]KQL53420.1 quinolinate synthetase [Heyndrickxia shackletonii]NEY99990.1 quinolinate synthase NadA [Heyndrickxia shackletonii]
MSIVNFLEQNKNIMISEQYLKMDQQEMETRVWEIKQQLGKELFLPVHHYQKDEVVQFADIMGDSLQLAQVSAKNKDAKYIVFCGVHFMAETADILTDDNQKVFLPDMRAGCSMADMADIFQTERAWKKLQSLFGDTIVPLTYVNSTAAIKAFVGKNGGATVTSSNAHSMIKWAFEQKERILFLPDQHLGRNTAYDIGIPLQHMGVWDPQKDELVFKGNIDDIKVILWKGHCSVHEKFTVQNIQYVREHYPNMNIIVHPECSREVVQLSDYNGSTKYIIDMISQADSKSEWAIGTEMNLVNRLINTNKDKHIISLNPNMCPCLTMNRIDLPHLLWNLESIVSGKPINQIVVDEETSSLANLALNRMLNR